MITTLVEIEHIKDFDEQGFYSKTYLAKDKRLNREVAVKDLFREDLTSSEDFEKYFDEAYKLSLAAHPRILPVFYVGFDNVADRKKASPRIVTKYLKFGSLNGHLKGVYNTGRSLCLDEIIRYAHDIIQGMIHLHSMDILHLDLKASNVYIGDDWKMVIGDFGQAKFIKDGILHDYGNIYPAIATVEALSKGAVDKTIDIYQFGLLLYSMVCYSQYRKAIDETFKLNTEVLRKLFRDKPPGYETDKKEFNKNMKLFLKAIKDKTFPSRADYPHYVHPKVRAIIEKCLDPVVAGRYNNFYEIQTDLNSIIFPKNVTDLYQDFSTGKIHFVKEDIPCEIGVHPVEEKFDLKPKKNGRNCTQSDKSGVTISKLPGFLLNLADEL